jgi:hypothetical protein
MAEGSSMNKAEVITLLSGTIWTRETLLPSRNVRTAEISKHKKEKASRSLKVIFRKTGGVKTKKALRGKQKFWEAAFHSGRTIHNKDAGDIIARRRQTAN